MMNQVLLVTMFMAIVSAVVPPHYFAGGIDNIWGDGFLDRDYGSPYYSTSYMSPYSRGYMGGMSGGAFPMYSTGGYMGAMGGGIYPYQTGGYMNTYTPYYSGGHFARSYGPAMGMSYATRPYFGRGFGTYGKRY